MFVLVQRAYICAYIFSKTRKGQVYCRANSLTFVCVHTLLYLNRKSCHLLSQKRMCKMNNLQQKLQAWRGTDKLLIIFITVLPWKKISMAETHASRHNKMKRLTFVLYTHGLPSFHFFFPKHRHPKQPFTLSEIASCKQRTPTPQLHTHTCPLFAIPLKHIDWLINNEFDGCSYVCLALCK